MSDSPATEVRLRWAPWWVLASVALWPLPGPAEAVLSLGALAALTVLLVNRFRGGMALLSHEAWALTSVLFLSYWLPELLSAPDAYNAPRAWREALLDLRYLPFLWLVAVSVANPRGRRIIFIGLAAVTGFWLLDGLVQAATGWSLGGQATADRLSGVFGADNLKLGLVLASLSPFLLVAAANRFGVAGWLATAVALVVVVLLAGSRASWLTLGLALVATGWLQFRARRVLLAAVLAPAVVMLAALAFSDTLQARFERTAAALEGGTDGVNHALSGRLPIWRAAVDMTLAHPINGVGVRSFRDAYPEFAREDDPWLVDAEHGAGYHAHQIVLEVLSETGLLGAFFWLGGAALAWRAWRFATPAARLRARAPALALAVTVFPFNTHLAVYSTFWGGLVLLLFALYAGSLLADDGREPAAGEA